MTIRPIRTDADYDAALDRARELMARSDQRSIDELDVLQMLIERWERTNHPIEAVTAAEAIRFRMAQTDMKPRELIPYLGTKSRVSEILSGQRQPTIDQIRALHQHLGIPIASLIGPIKHEPVMRPSIASRAAVEKLKALGVMEPREDLPAFLARAARIAPAVAMLRKTRTDRTNAKTDFGALEAWCAAVLVEAEAVQLPKTPRRVPGVEEARRLAQMSVLPDWPSRVVRALTEMGVVLVTLDHLPGTFLDGAAMRRGDGAPVIALTLRHDRLDNFWFTLLHELAHVSCHLGGETTVIFDDLDVNSADGIEAEADDFARNALVPNDLWARRVSSDMDVDGLMAVAMEAGVHPAVVAGRWRWEHSDYRRFSRLLGRGEVRVLLKG
ncbi:ImmA/IrrE family metallo-endopeptidase [Sphingomonas sp. AR_OL41]|uniref:ImmA/IrrE family metallo-endopeptidase n=1 Tax=Sphingomonas sp. AR_OL41 TaxID=3042729 RepID=UPI00247FE2B7|nr:ImmA/IrrE family metallo-endopeptidase [Sphingomonas sp. AR_OL41]MDH7972518.1 ImmA/IrrE family metallo-endopeptidase [Sphingomonas sp. AR_OL41]